MDEYSRYDRQMILKEIGRDGQRLLDESRVAILGLGALGSVSSQLLARAGVGHIVLIDRDSLEAGSSAGGAASGETDSDHSIPKAIAMRSRLREVNPEIRVDACVADMNPSNIDELLRGVHLIVDGTDNFETRFLVNDFCLLNRIPWIYGGAIGTEGMSYVILPGKTPCLRCLFGEGSSAGSEQTCDQVGILAPVAHLIASFQATEAIKLLAGKNDRVDRRLWKVDIWDRQFKSFDVGHLKRTPCAGCREREFPYLHGDGAARAVTLCGRNAVQIFQSGERKLELRHLASRLEGQAQVRVNDYLLHIRVDSCEITVFQNGRAIVKGTEDVSRARRLFTRYVGL